MIVILTQCFPSRFGGIESLISNLSINLGKKKDVTVLADSYNNILDTNFDKKHSKIIKVRRIKGIKFYRQRKKIFEFKKIIKSNKVELVIADTWKSLELCIKYINNNNLPTICLAHGNELLSKNIRKKQRINFTLNQVSAVVANSKYTCNLVKKIIPTKKNITFVYPGAEDLRKEKSKNFIKIDGGPILITLARLEKRKGHSLIINQIKKLITNFPKIRYIIAGEGPEMSNLKKLVKSSYLEKNVIFVGSIDNYQKKYLFENTDLMVMPTLNETHNNSIEGFGISYIEAAFFGIPSIASNIGGTPEAVLHNKTGIIIKKQKELLPSLNKLLSDKKKLSLLGKNAKIRAVKEFTWKKVIKHYLDCIV